MVSSFQALFLLFFVTILSSTVGFSIVKPVTTRSTIHTVTSPFRVISRGRDAAVVGLCMAAKDDDDDELELKRVSPDLEGIPIPFIDPATNSFIECYADSSVTIDGVTYTIAVPCDYSVALCYFDENEQLIPVELNDPLMDDIYPMAESIVADEFGEELVLQRTPQTLTLIGELEEDDDDEDFDDEDDEDDENEDEEVEVLLTYEHKGTEYNLVRLLDPILLVGKENPDDKDASDGGTRLLLSPEESDAIMPVLEDLFLKFHDGPNSMMS